jgi:hypothetical protein
MPRYFFHIVDGEEIIDDEGTTLAAWRKRALKPLWSQVRC